MTETFPVYRKYTNNKNYFKIINDNEFIEIKLRVSFLHKESIKK